MLKNKRKEIEDGILLFAKEVTDGGNNYNIYKNIFESVNDIQFEDIWINIKKRGYIPIFLDNFDSKEWINYNRLIELSKKWNIPLEQQLIITDPDTNLTITTPETAIVGIIEVTKQRQIIMKKFSGAKHDLDVDDLTGQPTGDSKSAGISNPEINMLIALGCPTTAKELASVKGGDLGAYREYKLQLTTTGKASITSSLEAGSGVKSLDTFHYLFRARHLDNNFNR